MNDDERRLLAAINRWRRDEHHNAGRVYPPTLLYGYETVDAQWRIEPPEWDPKARRWREFADEVGVREADQRGRWPTFARYYRARSVAAAVDLLVGLGVLPAWFSTAWRQGFVAGASAATVQLAVTLAL